MSLPCGLAAKTKNIRELSENQSKPILKTAAFNVSEKSFGYFDWNICCRTYFKLIGPVFMGVFPELAFVKHLCTIVYEFWKITSMPKIGFDLRLYKNSNEVCYSGISSRFSVVIFLSNRSSRNGHQKQYFQKCQHRVNSSNILKATLSAETCSDIRRIEV